MCGDSGGGMIEELALRLAALHNAGKLLLDRWGQPLRYDLGEVVMRLDEPGMVEWFAPIVERTERMMGVP